MAQRDRIIIVKRANPKRVTLPNGRIFYARYKCATHAELPANVHLERPYIQRAAPRGRRQHVRQGGRGFKSTFKKVINFAKKKLEKTKLLEISREWQ